MSQDVSPKLSFNESELERLRRLRESLLTARDNDIYKACGSEMINIANANLSGGNHVFRTACVDGGIKFYVDSDFGNPIFVRLDPIPLE